MPVRDLTLSEAQRDQDFAQPFDDWLDSTTRQKAETLPEGEERDRYVREAAYHARVLRAEVRQMAATRWFLALAARDRLPSRSVAPLARPRGRRERRTSRVTRAGPDDDPHEPDPHELATGSRHPCPIRRRWP
jgi:hypothetical protein